MIRIRWSQHELGCRSPSKSWCWFSMVEVFLRYISCAVIFGYLAVWIRWLNSLMIVELVKVSLEVSVILLTFLQIWVISLNFLRVLRSHSTLWPLLLVLKWYGCPGVSLFSIALWGNVADLIPRCRLFSFCSYLSAFTGLRIHRWKWSIRLIVPLMMLLGYLNLWRACRVMHVLILVDICLWSCLWTYT